MRKALARDLRSVVEGLSSDSIVTPVGRGQCFESNLLFDFDERAQATWPLPTLFLTAYASSECLLVLDTHGNHRARRIRDHFVRRRDRQMSCRTRKAARTMHTEND